MFDHYTSQGIQYTETRDGILLTCYISDDTFIEAFFGSMQDLREKFGGSDLELEDIAIGDLVDYWAMNGT